MAQREKLGHRRGIHTAALLKGILLWWKRLPPQPKADEPLEVREDLALARLIRLVRSIRTRRRHSHQRRRRQRGEDTLAGRGTGDERHAAAPRARHVRDHGGVHVEGGEERGALELGLCAGDS